MGRAPCCSKVGLHRGPWTSKEDTLLTNYIQAHGEGHWRSLPKKAGLLRCGKSCRLRWMNYLRPDIKRGNISPDEEDLIIRLHSLLGNRWSLIAGRLPGRTDNEIKNYWNTHLSKRLLKNQLQGTDPDHTHHQKKIRKRRTRNNSNKKQEQTALTTTTEMTKIHLPKPIRVTSIPISRNNSFEYNTVSGSSGSHSGVVGTEIMGLSPWSSDHLNNVGGDYCGVHVNGCDFGCESQLPTRENMLEKLYEEYLQVLLKKEEEKKDQEEEKEDQIKLDSFAESLWV